MMELCLEVPHGSHLAIISGSLRHGTSESRGTRAAAAELFCNGESEERRGARAKGSSRGMCSKLWILGTGTSGGVPFLPRLARRSVSRALEDGSVWWWYTPSSSEAQGSENCGIRW